MSITTTASGYPSVEVDASKPERQSAVSWAAVLAGAAASAAFSLILLMLGTGLGLSSISPWAGRGAGPLAFGISAIAWITVTQIMSSGIGGYLAGRLRTKWTAIHGDETYFRDTAHGFLAWSIATLVTATLIASAIASLVSGAATVAGDVAGKVAQGAGTVAAAKSSDPTTPDSMSYAVDSLFRTDGTTPVDTAISSTPKPTAEVGRIMLTSLRSGMMTPDDTRYVGSLVAQRTGLSAADAEKRVTTAYQAAQAKLQEFNNAARDAADKARKATVYASLWLFVSLLCGAFTASLAATYGGRERDDMHGSITSTHVHNH